MAGSRSGKGDGLDHAVAERFVGSVKRERTSTRSYRTRQEAREDVIDSIEMFSNSWRQHSYLGYVSPNAYEEIAQAASLCVRFPLTTTDVHGTGMQVDTAGKWVWRGVKSHGGLLLLRDHCFPMFSIPRWFAGEGASISIKGVQATANSVRSCLAPAIRRA